MPFCDNRTAHLILAAVPAMALQSMHHRQCERAYRVGNIPCPARLCRAAAQRRDQADVPAGQAFCPWPPPGRM